MLQPHTVDNQAPALLDVHLARQESAADTRAACYVRLRNEMIGALIEDPSRVIATPGFGPGSAFRNWSAADCVNDNFAGAGGESVLIKLLHIVGRLADGKPSVALHLEAKAVVAQIADQHALFHADDAADNELDASEL